MMKVAQGLDFLLIASALGYVLAAILYFLRLTGRSQSSDAVSAWVLGVGAALHTVHFLSASAVLKACPVEGIHLATSLTALVVVALFLIARRFWQVDAIGAFITPMALLALLAARFAGRSTLTSSFTHNALIPFHVTTILLASASFTISAALALAYLLQEKRLKDKSLLGQLHRLPPLHTLDLTSHRFLLIGFPLLTLGILTGLVNVQTTSTKNVAWLRQILAYAAWVIFAGVLIMRALAGWRGRRAAWGTLLGFGFAALIFFVYFMRNATLQGH